MFNCSVPLTAGSWKVWFARGWLSDKVRNAASAKPLVSAVGHQTDHVLPDDAADAFALTPTGAAQMVVPSMEELRGETGDAGDRLRAGLVRRVEVAAQRLDESEARLRSVGVRLLAEPRGRLALLGARLAAGHPARRLVEERGRLEHARARLRAVGTHLVDRPRGAVETLAARLAPLSPWAPLDRGYALARMPDGRLVRSHQDVVAGDALDVLLGRGALSVEVTKTRPDRDA